MREQAQMIQGKQIADTVRRSFEDLAELTARQTRQAGSALTKNVREHPVAWTVAGVAAAATALGFFLARGVRR